jgi:hypothetical protein
MRLGIGAPFASSTKNEAVKTTAITWMVFIEADLIERELIKSWTTHAAKILNVSRLGSFRNRKERPNDGVKA